MSATLTELRDDFQAVREARREGRAINVQQRVAFERYFRAAAAADQPLDALSRRSANEVERFWAQTIPGVDGHIYWDGPQSFRRNDGKCRRPQRWVWEQHYRRPLSRYIDVWTTCGEKNCIAALHLAAGRNDARRRYTDEQLLGYLQVAAMRLGHTPRAQWWEKQRG